MGGTVEKFDGGWSVGLNTYTLRGQTYDLNAWHQDQVTTLPEGAANIGSSPFCENAMLYYEGKALTIQPHPEFDARSVKALLDTKAKGVVPENLQATATARLPQADHNATLGAQLAHFLKTKSLA